MTKLEKSHVFEGYAVISADGLIADADGRMPDCLKFDADWDYFQAALDHADITLLGRLTHEAAPNIKKRRRLVFSSRVDGLVKTDETTYWIDPAQTDLHAAITEISGPSSKVAVVGGRGVFDWVLSKPGFSAFHLSIARKVQLGRGLQMFKAAPDLEAALALLETNGLRVSHRVWLDQDAGLELLVYRQS